MGILEDLVKNETFVKVPGLADDIVTVVRCKDCEISKLEKVFKNVPTSTETVRWCELINRYVDDDWFCADGKRKEGR